VRRSEGAVSCDDRLLLMVGSFAAICFYLLSGNIYVVTFIIDERYFCCYVKPMIIEFDAAKREKTLLERGLDFTDSDKVFGGLHFIARDDRSDYGEERFITVGLLDSRMVVIVWTPRDDARRIIFMRYANDREISRYKKHLA
jgi:uncharacterized protein